MVECYLLESDPLPDPEENKEVLEGIPEWRKKEILRIRREENRKLSYGAWRLLEKALKAHNINPDTVKKEESGKPVCDDLFFSLSHTSGLIFCVLSDKPIGCDTEKLEENSLEIAKHFFKKREIDYIYKADGLDEKVRRFFRLWTSKESFLKMTGEGIAELSFVEIKPESNTVLFKGKEQNVTLINAFYKDYALSLCYLE